jgi:dephospho-CoA kinase|tara:strand:- start:3118 stop:3729 length:612 start_codon:yes stop_codon:yes gene_type:complete
MSFLVGLTGGIGSGKSTAGNYFKQLGIEVVNADIVARDIVKKGSIFHIKIADYFGKKSLLLDYSLDRAFIRKEIFEAPEKRAWLEALLHPPIRKEIINLLALSASAYTVLESPLLVETSQHKLADRILVIDVPESLQVQRTSKRDGGKQNTVQSIINSQMQRSERLRFANDIIDNTSDIKALKIKIDRLHELYLTLATQKNAE